MAERKRARPELRVIEGGVPLKTQLTYAILLSDAEEARARMKAIGERMRACRPRIRLATVDGRWVD